ncbi:RagB/SusD family nutrient uptake outer membrane protein [Maribacter sp. 2304DJ31-5]|uniref:RagB/SusD family nutrient uptake outer membrane protein n=1 Tax=Maribacter sp. 2304DJ31-5 TaxID=3386273 RepID=UPI0039BC6C18
MNKIKNSILISIFCMVVFSSCDQSLEEELFDVVSTNNFFQDDEDIINASNAIYSNLRGHNRTTTNDPGWGLYTYADNVSLFHHGDAPTDVFESLWADGFPGGFWGRLTLFTFNQSSATDPYRKLFEGVSICNNILENVASDNEELSEEIRNRVRGEAFFGRALHYYYLYNMYRNIPLITEVNGDPFFLPEQANPQDIFEQMVSDLESAIGLLPATYANEDYGRFTQGAAYALQARLYLNEKMWVEAAESAQNVMNLGVYQIVNDFNSIFAPDNTGNPEIILSMVSSNAVAGIGNVFVATTAPADFVSSSWGGARVPDSFYDTFDSEDIRRSVLLKEYESNTGQIRQVTDGAIILKYGIDDGRIGPWASNDIVVDRYANVLLTRAEALNELNGPNQESIDLINQIRDRAFNNDNSKRISLSDFASKDDLRDHILAERAWELYSEGFRREDLIRHGKFISSARERGLLAQDHQVLYAIPQSELNRNPNLDQNPGYIN